MLRAEKQTEWRVSEEAFVQRGRQRADDDDLHSLPWGKNHTEVKTIWLATAHRSCL